MDYPGAAMSENSINSLLQRIGMNGSNRRRFYQLRMQETAADHHIAIDGTLKQDNSQVNDLSAYSRKARVRGCREVSVLYAYDIERMEPLCAEVFPGKSRLANGAYFSYNNSYSLEGVAICQSKKISHEGKRHGMRSRH
jgi:hypothetical protein